ncbi:hypothetical protein G6L37_03380 [Agrobacterium rubi]|nr:hypothetical protein [Agrobacterium rubi]NTF24413.1 hypothetical protein [Agrobacterium rubi]
MRVLKASAMAAYLAAATVPALAQETPIQDAPTLPGSVFVLPEGGTSPVSPDEDPEIVSDIKIFRDKGFQEPDWQTHTAQVDEVLRDVVLPDWRKRSGKNTDPEIPSIDIAAASVLGGDYNDLLVMSRLPGDCGPTGCMFQLYSLVNDVWVKRFEFKTVAFAWKADEAGTRIAQVGGMWIPSRTHQWLEGQLR